MTSAELLAAIRIRFDDVATPYLASDATILEQASLAQTEFARNTLALYGVASGAVTANDPWLTVPSNFFVLKTVILNGKQLRPVTVSELDFGYFTLNSTENSKRFANWRAATGTPKFVVTDMYPDKVRLVPYATANSTVSMEGYVTPSELTLPTGIPPTGVNPEIPEAYHELLITGTLFRLNMQTDIDTFNQGKAQLYSTLWYQGIAEAQNNLRTSLRRQVRVMELPRTFAFDVVNASQAANNEQSG
jgi:hypothetical protein